MEKATSYEFWTISELMTKIHDNQIKYGENQRNSDLHDNRSKGTIINTLLSPLNDIQQITVTHNGDGSYNVDDGQQRINNIIAFITNQYELKQSHLHESCRKDFWSLYKKTIKYEELTQEQQQHFLNGTIPVKIIDKSKLEHISCDYMFNALNIALSPLNGDEILHGSYYGKYLDFIKSNFDNEYLNEIGFITKQGIQRLKPLRPLIMLSEQYIYSDFINGEKDNIGIICESRRNYDISVTVKQSIEYAVNVVKMMFTVNEIKCLELYRTPSFFNILVYVISLYHKYNSVEQIQLVKKGLIRFHNDVNNGGVQDESDREIEFKKLKILSLVSDTRRAKGSLSGIVHKTNIARSMFEYISFEDSLLKEKIKLIGQMVPTLKLKIQL